MGWGLGAVSIVVALLLLLAVTPIDVSLRLERKGKRQDMSATIKVWYILKKSYYIPVISVDEENKSLIIKEKEESSISKPKEKDIEETPEDLKRQIETVRLFVHHIHGLLTIVKKLVGRMKVKQLEWKSQVGISDAAWAGILSGMLWSVKGTFAGVIAAFFKLKCEPVLHVQPDFKKTVFQTEFSCIVGFKLGHAIIAGIRVLKQLNGSMFSLWKKAKEMNMNNKEAS